MTDYSAAASAELEKPENYKFDFIPVKENTLTVEWVYPEFQSICPLSGRHDQGTLTLTYIPKDRLLESKSMRDYLTAWRNMHNWQENITEEIASSVFKSLEPKGLKVEIEWTPRGGIYARTVSRKGDALDL
ncbi:MAG: preQ(1) synthase [Spirochaetes bacterium]|nr:preQ(1) synthase [Spirochaetota bacterium]